jgi:hypothetical protein
MATPTAIAAVPFNGVNIIAATSAFTAPNSSQSNPNPYGSTLSTNIRAPTLREPLPSASILLKEVNAPISPKFVVAMGVGSGAGIMIIIGMFIWLVMWHRRRSLNYRRNGPVSHKDISWPLELRQELPGEDSLFEVHGEHKRFELSCNTGLAHELGQPHQILELDCRRNVRHSAQELNAGPWEPILEPYEIRRGLILTEEEITPVDIISPL